MTPQHSPSSTPSSTLAVADTFPDTVRAAAQAALAASFPGGTLQRVELLHGGLSGSLVCKVTVDDAPYVLRAIMKDSLLADAARQFTCMRLAADIGVAPRVLHADAESGISIIAYVPPPSTPDGRPAARNAGELGVLLRTLHRGPEFPTLMSAFDMIEGSVPQLGSLALPGLVRAVLEAYPNVKRTLLPHLVNAPCHNDLNPGNVLSGPDRLWLVDWDGACSGDPILDVAGLIHWFGFDAPRRAEFLAAYHDGEPTTYDEAKLLVMEQISWCLYMMIFLLISRSDDGLGDLDTIAPDTLPSFREALGQIAGGSLKLQELEGRRRLALVMAHQSLSDMARPAFQEAMHHLERATALPVR